MPFRPSVAAAFAPGLAGTASAAPCDNSLASSPTFREAILAAGIEIDEGLEPVEHPQDELKFSDLAEDTQREIEGTVMVLLLVGTDGAVVDRVIVCAEPFGYFEASVLDWTKGFGFAPIAKGTPERYRSYLVKARFLFR